MLSVLTSLKVLSFGKELTNALKRYFVHYENPLDSLLHDLNLTIENERAFEKKKKKKKKIWKNWLIVWGLTPFSTVFHIYHGDQYIYPYLPGVPLASTLHNILSKPLGAFPHNHCRNNGQRWERNESCRNDYNQSSERILAEPEFERATSWSQVRNATVWAMGCSVWKGEYVRQVNQWMVIQQILVSKLLLILRNH